jgi:predicted ester cyclase
MGFARMAQAWFTAFPDMSVKQTNRVVSDDAVGAEVQFTGTNSGPMMMAGKEIPPTGKSVIGRGTYFARVRDGKVVEFNSYPDIPGMMMQLGFMPVM